jgi:hypothetical protein
VEGRVPASSRIGLSLRKGEGWRSRGVRWHSAETNEGCRENHDEGEAWCLAFNGIRGRGERHCRRQNRVQIVNVRNGFWRVAVPEVQLRCYQRGVEQGSGEQQGRVNGQIRPSEAGAHHPSLRPVGPGALSHFRRLARRCGANVPEIGGRLWLGHVFSGGTSALDLPAKLWKHEQVLYSNGRCRVEQAEQTAWM